jgi:hypothetical protein
MNRRAFLANSSLVGCATLNAEAGAGVRKRMKITEATFHRSGRGGAGRRAREGRP